ncbi:39S ribosomal protein L14-like protein [Leptotrombidium deliense]|uniref:Large ribosomal subunit protein uL14m n=1 Tax=Leptotrombidium deliense TaxID=299467 RepID=A0A443S1G0_9ACAR|nr:39S ribosomal protein L14-like protein [Leptotrombidium deliense]
MSLNLVRKFRYNFRTFLWSLIRMFLFLTSTTNSLLMVQRRSRLRVVDNSPLGKQAMLEGKPPRMIHVCYSRMRHGFLGDKVLVTIKGQMKHAIIVGTVQEQRAFTPRYDSNNIVLLDEQGNPLGTRILTPIPNRLRGKGQEMSKLIAIGTKFV